MTDPFAKMLDRQALAYQAQFGGSYEQAYVKIYTDPTNRSIVDQARYEHLAGQHDAMHGSRLATIPATKAAPPDPKQDFVARAVEDRGPAHSRLHEMALEHSRAHGLTYQQSYTRLFTSPENVALRAGIAAEAGVRTLTLKRRGRLLRRSPSRHMAAPVSVGRATWDAAGLNRRVMLAVEFLVCLGGVLARGFSFFPARLGARAVSSTAFRLVGEDRAPRSWHGTGRLVNAADRRFLGPVRRHYLARQARGARVVNPFFACGATPCLPKPS